MKFVIPFQFYIYLVIKLLKTTILLQGVSKWRSGSIWTPPEAFWMSGCGCYCYNTNTPTRSKKIQVSGVGLWLKYAWLGWLLLLLGHLIFVVQIMKAKYKNIRTYYVKEQKKVNASIRSGAGANDCYKPTWSHFPELHFMIATVEQRATQSSVIENQPAAEPDVSQHLHRPTKSLSFIWHPLQWIHYTHTVY